MQVSARGIQIFYDTYLTYLFAQTIMVAYPSYFLLFCPLQDDEKYFILNIMITEIFLRSIDWLCPPVALLEKFLEFFTTALSEEV